MVWFHMAESNNIIKFRVFDRTKNKFVGEDNYVRETGAYYCPVIDSGGILRFLVFKGKECATEIPNPKDFRIDFCAGANENGVTFYENDEVVSKNCAGWGKITKEGRKFLIKWFPSGEQVFDFDDMCNSISLRAAEVRKEKKIPVQLTSEQIKDVCYSLRHDFGLNKEIQKERGLPVCGMTSEERAKLIFDIKEYYHAIQKVFNE